METAPCMKKIETETSDSLSSLPDELIVSILSLLPAKEVARTCILSKRWRNLWTIVPSLCFDSRDWDGDLEKFAAFVSKFLHKRDGATDTHIFRILCHGMYINDNLDPIYSEATKWVTYAVEDHPRILELSFSGCCSLHIPDCLFTCKTLENLKLKMRGWDLLELKSSAVYLPRLTNLNLNRINFNVDNFDEFLSRCPILKDLSMEYCALNMPKFSCHSVKRLQIHYPRTSDETLSISAPCVENLVFNGDMDSRIILKDMPMVTQAIITVHSFVKREEYNCHLLSRLNGINSLDISSICSKEMLQEELQKCPIFQSLKFLFLHEFCPYCGFDTWSSFIKHCPNLEELYLVPLEGPCEVNHEEHRRAKEHQNSEQIERFSCKGLKTVGIVYRRLSYSVHHLVERLKYMTKVIKGLQIVLLEDRV
ncbi:hypothetical protein LUZ62_017588 [Rhynchospora pubera]|uniref:F-box domain-containing protein n=1 Tax=Rhynchospora pubera TaxID=906938 RepID=A0AAV8GRF5_9POAL|nr:hypothetical protein LUZ62_017588 [Rhynchospora pubera]